MEKVATALHEVTAALREFRKGEPGKAEPPLRMFAPEQSSILDKETRILLAAFLLHYADISNPSKEWPLCERWAVIVMNECFSQGDVERKLVHTAESQPLENFETNQKHWEEIAKQEEKSGKPYLMKLNPPPYSHEAIAIPSESKKMNCIPISFRIPFIEYTRQFRIKII